VPNNARRYGALSLVVAALIGGCAQPELYIPGNPPLVVQCGIPDPGARPGPALVGLQYGMQMSPLPLNSVQFDGPATASRVAVQNIFAERTVTDTVSVTARLVSCADIPTTVKMRTSFMRANQGPAEGSSAWRVVFLAPRAIAHYTELSTSRDSASYLIEIAAE
jgi:hypothetical protein